MKSARAAVAPTSETGIALVEEMLKLAHMLVREGWCQGAQARDASGRPVLPGSTFACQWSAAGALERVWARYDDRFGLGLEAFERANLALAAATGDVPQAWNDDVGRTLPEVLDAFAVALQLAADPARTDFRPPTTNSDSA